MLDYRVPSTPPVETPPTEVLSRWSLIIIAAVATLCLGGIVPHFQSDFELWRTDLPGVTKLVVGLSNWFVTGFGWTFIWTCAFLVPRAVARLRLRKLERGGTTQRVAVAIGATAVACGVIVAATWFAWYAPQITILQSVSAPRG